MKGLGAALCALVLTLAACAGSDSQTQASPTTNPAPTTTSVPEPVPVLSEVLGFIEVSALIVVGQSGERVALAVDSELLSQIELGEPQDSPAWCSGSLSDVADLDLVEDFLVLLRGAAVDLTLGGAQLFELRAPEARLGEEPSAAEILLISDGVRYEVPRGELFLGENFTSGTFRGTATNGVVIEGAFLCG